MDDQDKNRDTEEVDYVELHVQRLSRAIESVLAADNMDPVVSIAVLDIFSEALYDAVLHEECGPDGCSADQELFDQLDESIDECKADIEPIVGDVVEAIGVQSVTAGTPDATKAGLN